MAPARYDGHADWYDATFGFLGAETGLGGLLGHLLGPAERDGQVCLDVGCGTGRHFRAAQASGYTVLGVDLSADQLRVAATRNPRLVRAEAGRLPLPDASIAAVVMTFVHTDVDHFGATIGEAARVLRPGGLLVHLGVHPAYVGAFVDRTAETETREVRVTGGYGDERLHRDPSGRFPVRSRVGARNLTLTTLLTAFLAQATLRVTSIAELDTDLQPWRPSAGDHRILPWNLAITARADLDQQRTDRSTPVVGKPPTPRALRGKVGCLSDRQGSRITRMSRAPVEGGHGCWAVAGAPLHASLDPSVQPPAAGSGGRTAGRA